MSCSASRLSAGSTNTSKRIATRSPLGSSNRVFGDAGLGTALDIFGYSAERRSERQLISDYEETIAGLLPTLDGGNVDLAAQIASIPEHIRGYGHVKEAHLEAAKAREAELLVQWRNPLRIVQAA